MEQIMKKTNNRTYSSYADIAVQTLGEQIKMARLERRITMKDLCERAGVSRGLLHRLENGDPSCNIGSAFEIATILGLPLFQSDNYDDLAFKAKIAKDKLALLPSRARPKKVKINDDF